MKEIDTSELRSKFIDSIIEGVSSSRAYKGYVPTMISDDMLMLYDWGGLHLYYNVGKLVDEMVHRYLEDGETIFPIKLGCSDEAS